MVDGGGTDAIRVGVRLVHVPAIPGSGQANPIQSCSRSPGEVIVPTSVPVHVCTPDHLAVVASRDHFVEHGEQLRILMVL